MATDNFEIKTIQEFPGYNSANDKTLLAPGFLVRGSQNVYKKLSGSIAIRPGLKRLDDADATLAGVDASFDWITSLGRNYELQVANSKLRVFWNGAYYDLLTGLTLSRFIFDTWWDNTDKKDKLIFVQGNSNLYAWSGGITTVASGTVNTITKSDNSTTWGQDGFASTGTVTINGVDYTYSGGTGTDTLTGVGTDASGLTNGLTAIQTVVVTSNKPASGFLNDFIKVIGNRLHVGSYTSRLCYISKQSDYTDFSVPGVRAPGDAELLTLDSTLKGIGVRQGNAHIAAGTSDWYVVSYSPLTVGSTLTEQTKVDKVPGALLDAALGHEFIDTVGDDLIYLDQDHQLRVFGTFRNLSQSRIPTLSLEVKTELQNEVFTGGHVRAIGNIIYITAPISGKDYMYETRQSISELGNIQAERFWHPPQVRNISRFAIIAGVIYGHSNANPQIYQVWDTLQWHDDSPSDEPLQYDANARFSYATHGRREGLFSFDKAFYEGYISPGSTVYARQRYNYQGAESIQDHIINNSESAVTVFSGTNAPSMGDSPIGDNPLGDGLSAEEADQELLPKFKVIIDSSPVDCFEYQLEVLSIDIDSRWELLALGTNAEESEANATFIRK